MSAWYSCSANWKRARSASYFWAATTNDEEIGMEFGLIGKKLGHSYSPMIHARLGNYAYELCEIPPENLERFLKSGNYRGFNVTIPYKRDVLPYLNEISPIAQEIGCVNTVIRREDGTLYGHNTDIGGFMHMLRRAGIDPKNRKAAILGSGGTSLTARTALRLLGAKETVVVSRSGPVNYEALHEVHSDIEILVNTTPVGMYPHNGECAVDLSRFPKLCGVVDVVYNPSRTALILNAQALGIPCVSGLPMLVAQAREAAELFMGKKIDPSVDDSILREILSQSLNLVLIGMPGCGKTALGQRLSARMNRPLLDSDEEIVKHAGMSIPDLFAKYGEEYFRALETQVLQDLCKESGCIIATGGGAVLREENRRAMRQNGRLCLICRALENLPRSGRPLSKSQDALQEM
ncbi:MAG: AAA family ATPase, partial [Clostridia bacterium]|nr:AAA family ATPase [Clostridia bacterium]